MNLDGQFQHANWRNTGGEEGTCSVHSAHAQPAQRAEEMGITKVHMESEEEDYSYAYRLVKSKYSLFLFKRKNQFICVVLFFLSPGCVCENHNVGNVTADTMPGSLFCEFFRPEGTLAFQHTAFRLDLQVISYCSEQAKVSPWRSKPSEPAGCWHTLAVCCSDFHFPP